MVVGGRRTGSNKKEKGSKKLQHGMVMMIGYW